MSALGRTEDVADSSSTKPREPLFLLLGLVLVTACLYWARQVLIPLALAVLLAFILTPAVSALQGRGLGRLPSVLMVVTLALLLLSEIGYVSSPQINTFGEHPPNYRGELIKNLKPLLGGEEEDAS